MIPAKKLAYALAALLLAAIVIGVFLPSGTRIQREIIIDAPAATVFALVDDLRRAQDWLPFIDPGAQIDLGEPSRGIGAAIAWDGAQSGRAKQTITDSVPFERVTAELDFDRGGDVQSSMVVAPTENGTRVAWTYAADLGINLLARYRSLLFARGIEGRLERGLLDLKTLAESLPRADWSEIDIQRSVVMPLDIAYLTASSLPNASDLSEAMGDAYFKILAYIDRHGLYEAGPPLSITRRFSGSRLVFDAAIPVRGVQPETPVSENGIQLGKTYGGPVVRGRHVGSYGTLSETHEKIAAYLAVHGVSRAGDAWEAYVSDPARTPEDELITDVFYPVGE